MESSPALSPREQRAFPTLSLQLLRRITVPLPLLHLNEIIILLRDLLSSQYYDIKDNKITSNNPLPHSPTTTSPQSHLGQYLQDKLQAKNPTTQRNPTGLATLSTNPTQPNRLAISHKIHYPNLSTISAPKLATNHSTSDQIPHLYPTCQLTSPCNAPE